MTQPHDTTWTQPAVGFHAWPRVAQWPAAVALCAAACVLTVEVLEHLNYIGGLLALVLLAPLLQFAFTPLLRLLGVYRYYAPLLLVFAPNAKTYDLHGGTSFDYLHHIRWRDRGPQVQRQVLRSYLLGLLHIAREIVAGRLSASVEVSGVSYFFSPSSARRLGFRLQTPSLFYRLNLLVNVVDLVWMYSLAQGRLTLPNVLDAKKAVITGAELAQQIPRLEALLARLDRPPHASLLQPVSA